MSYHDTNASRLEDIISPRIVDGLVEDGRTLDSAFEVKDWINITQRLTRVEERMETWFTRLETRLEAMQLPSSSSAVNDPEEDDNDVEDDIRPDEIVDKGKHRKKNNRQTQAWDADTELCFMLSLFEIYQRDRVKKTISHEVFVEVGEENLLKAGTQAMRQELVRIKKKCETIRADKRNKNPDFQYEEKKPGATKKNEETAVTATGGDVTMQDAPMPAGEAVTTEDVGLPAATAESGLGSGQDMTEADHNVDNDFRLQPRTARAMSVPTQGPQLRGRIGELGENREITDAATALFGMAAQSRRTNTSDGTGDSSSRGNDPR